VSFKAPKLAGGCWLTRPSIHADQKLLIVTLFPGVIIALISLGYIIPLLVIDRL
jgi:hypothetical protein